MDPNEVTNVPLAFFQTNEIILTGTFRYANTYPTAIDLAAKGKVDLYAMVTSHYGLPETEEALQASGKVPANVKPMVMPNGA
jgi:L-iditol 2-dehydrogenase